MAFYVLRRQHLALPDREVPVLEQRLGRAGGDSLAERFIMRDQFLDYDAARPPIGNYVVAGQGKNVAFSLLVFFIAIAFLVQDDLRNELVEKISNDTLLQLLALLATFATLLAYIFKTQISRELKDEHAELFRQERIASRTETKLALAYGFWYFYHHPASHARPEERGAGRTQSRFLKLAIRFVENCMDDVLELHDPEYADMAFEVKNNLAYYLADSREDEVKAFALKDDLWVFLQSGRKPRHLPVNPYATWMETCAWVIYCFASGDVEKIEEAHAIVRSLERYVDAARFEYLKKKYGMP